MVNKKQKGNKAENELANYYKELGWAVQVAQRTSKFTGKFYVSMDNDFFNLFDIFTLNNKFINLIQVKTNKNHVYKAMKEIKVFADKYNPGNVVYKVALRVSRKGWIIWKYHPYDKKWDKYFFNFKLESVEPFTYS